LVTFQPHNRQEVERQITRQQRSFAKGMFADVTAEQIPDDGVAYLKNYKNLGFALEGRTGSRRWGNYSTGIPHADLPTSDTLNAIKQHTFSKKVLILLGSDIYIADDINFSGWTKCYCESYQSPADEISSFDEQNQNMILYNSNGIYKIDLTDTTSTIFYYKINSSVPTSKLLAPDITNVSDRKRKYTYTLSKSNSSGLTTDENGNYRQYFLNCINRTSVSFSLLSESGSVLPDLNYQDYTEVRAMQDGDGSSYISGFIIPTVDGTNKERHWDYFSIYCTPDVSASGIDPVSGVGNNTEQYIWLEDIPVCYAWKMNQAAGSAYNMSSYSGQEMMVSDNLIGSRIMLYTPSSGFVSGIIGATLYHAPSDMIFNITDSNSSAITIGAIGTTSFCFYGAGSGALITISGGVVSPISGNTFVLSDANKRIFLSDGRKLHISGVSGTSGIVYETDVVYSTSIAGCWGVQEGSYGSLYFSDYLEEEDLKSRITSYPLYQRFYQNLPDPYIGKVIPGWMVVSEENKQYMYYSQLAEGYEYLNGYYHPGYQFTLFTDIIKGYGLLVDKLVVYGSKSTHTIPINVISSINIAELGVDISVLTNQIVADTTIGIMDYHSICDVELGKQIVITSEPGIRIFDGNVYSENFADTKISNVLKQIGTNVSAVYSPYIGYIFWGRI
jgi:hypothetical protein